MVGHHQGQPRQGRSHRARRRSLYRSAHQWPDRRRPVVYLGQLHHRGYQGLGQHAEVWTYAGPGTYSPGGGRRSYARCTVHPAGSHLLRHRFRRPDDLHAPDVRHHPGYDGQRGAARQPLLHVRNISFVPVGAHHAGYCRYRADTGYGRRCQRADL